MKDKQTQINEFFSAAKIKSTCVEVIKLHNGFGMHLKLSPGTKLSKVESTLDELLLALKAHGIGYHGADRSKGTYYLEIIEQAPKSQPFTEALVDLAKTPSTGILPIHLGTGLNGSKISMDLAENPNLLIGGATGSGKTNVLHTIITNLLLYSDSYISIIDSKRIDFSHYLNIQNIKNRLCTVHTFEDALSMIQIMCKIMDTRYKWIAENANNLQSMQPMVLIIDEFADLSLEDINDELRLELTRLVQKSRAARIFTVLATQRPSFEVITGTIKANFPARIACKTASKIDSRIILDENGAEDLTSIGDTIIKNYKYNLEKYKSYYTNPAAITNYININ